MIKFCFKIFKVAVLIALVGLAMTFVDVLINGPSPKEGATDIIHALTE